jgi:hypothetical protein
VAAVQGREVLAEDRGGDAQQAVVRPLEQLPARIGVAPPQAVDQQLEVCRSVVRHVNDACVSGLPVNSEASLRPRSPGSYHRNERPWLGEPPSGFELRIPTPDPFSREPTVFFQNFPVPNAKSHCLAE